MTSKASILPQPDLKILDMTQKFQKITLFFKLLMKKAAFLWFLVIFMKLLN